MKTKVCKILSVIMMFILITVSAGYSKSDAYADDDLYTVEEAYKIIEQRQKEAREKAALNANDENAPRTDPEFLDRSFEATEIYNWIINRIYEKHDILSDSFAGGYVNDDGYLTVMLINNFDECKNIIFNEFESKTIYFEVAEHSYIEMQNLQESLNEKIGLMHEMSCKGELTDPEEINLMKAYPRAELKEKENIVTLTVDISKYGETAAADDTDGQMRARFAAAVKKIFGENDAVKYEYDTDYKPAELMS